MKHTGSFVDYGGNIKVLDEAVVANYPDIKTTNGCSLVLLEADGDGDNIDAKATKAQLESVYNVRFYEGGSYRFDRLPMVSDKIVAFVEVAELVMDLVTVQVIEKATEISKSKNKLGSFLTIF